MSENKGNAMNSDLWQVPVPVEQGLYEAVFKGVEDFEIKEGAFPGVKWRWKFEICSGTHVGRIVSGVCNRKLSPGTVGLKFVTGLLGRGLEPKENVLSRVKECEGKAFTINFKKSDKGNSVGVQDVFKK